MNLYPPLKLPMQPTTCQTVPCPSPPRPPRAQEIVKNLEGQCEHLESFAARLEQFCVHLLGPIPQDPQDPKVSACPPSSHDAQMDRISDRIQQIETRLRVVAERLETFA